MGMGMGMVLVMFVTTVRMSAILAKAIWITMPLGTLVTIATTRRWTTTAA